MDLAISYVNETAAHNHKVEHVPGVAEVVLVEEGEEGRTSQREKGTERKA